MNSMSNGDPYSQTVARPLLPSVQIIDNQFFDTTTYRGGFDGRGDWTVGWTHQVTGGQ